MKNNKGIAMVYTVMTMLLVFAICMLITTIMLAQITYTKTYTDRAETERLYTQIGEIFYDCGGQYYNNEQEEPVADKVNSPFAQALRNANFDIEDNRDTNWKVTSGSYEFVLEFLPFNNEYGNELILEIKNPDNQRSYLTVGLRITDDKTELIQWSRTT
ncbi:MAG: hypothetical protein J1F36_06520 [Clostridiales bacterium]|nr:hypothetical protein [Clostridiales bacterium]